MIKYILAGFTLLCFFAGVLTGRPVEAQNINDLKISVTFKDQNVKDVLSKLESLTGYTFIYNSAHIDEKKKVSLDAINKPFSQVLSELFTPFNLTYKQVNNSVVLKPKPPKTVLGKGAVQGRIKDAITKEPLIGVSVYLSGTTLGAATDVNGNYKIVSVPEGNYMLIFSYVSYEEMKFEVNVSAGKTIEQSIELNPKQNELAEFIIRGEKVHNNSTETSMLSEIKNSSLIVTGISSQQITRSMDFDASEVAKRMPGVVILNNFVNIRGLHERYNMTYLNGMIAPSSDADKRAFSYDLLPSNMLDRIMLYRSPAPELPADWAGGAMKIYTRNTTQSKQIQIQLSTQFRPQSAFKEYYSYHGGKTDWMGFDDGTRAMPDNFPGVGKIEPKPTLSGAGASFPNDPEALDQNGALGKQLSNNWNLKRKYSNLDKRAIINYYDTWKVGKFKLNNLTSVSTTQSTLLYNQNSDFFENGMEQYKDTLSKVSSRWGLLENLALVLDEYNKIEFRNLFNQQSTDQTLIRDGVNKRNDSGMDYDQLRSIQYSYKSRSIYSGQLAGAHEFGKTKSNKLEWGLGYSYTKENIPDQRLFRMGRNLIPEQDSLTAWELPNTELDQTVGHLYSNSLEKGYNLVVDYEKKLKSGISFKAGLFGDYREKNFDTRLIRTSFKNFTVPYSRPEFHMNEILDPEKYGAGGFLIYDEPKMSGQFNASNEQYAGYAAINLPLFSKRLNIYGGVRYEWNHMKSNSLSKQEVAAGNKLSYDSLTRYFLPSVNISWSFTSKLLLRGAYGKTLSRPQFRELLDIYIYDLQNNITRIGNSRLGNGEIHNFDLRLEYYPTEGEFISIGGFYKSFHNAIENYVSQIGSSTNETLVPSNTPHAVVYGIEAEVRKKLDFTPVDFLSNFSMIANFALLKSEVEFSKDVYDALPRDYRKQTRRLEGTAPFVINGGLYYDNLETGTKITALYNVLGSRLVYAGSSYRPEMYDMPRHQIDLVVKQRLKKWLEVSFGVQDLLNQPYRYYRDYDRNQYWSRNVRNKLGGKDWMQTSYKQGSYYSLGINMTF